MQNALSGISTIWVVIGVGWLIGHLGIVDSPGRRLMSLLAFSVASPMLLFSLVSKADLGHLFSTTVVVSTLAVAVAGGMLIFGGELNDFARRLMYVVLVAGILLGATQIVALFDEAGRQREPKPFIINYVGKAPFPELLLDPELD